MPRDAHNNVEKPMVVLKKENSFKEIVPKMDNNSRLPKAKFEAFGEEMIEKKSNKVGRADGSICLPNGWVNISRLFGSTDDISRQ